MTATPPAVRPPAPRPLTPQPDERREIFVGGFGAAVTDAHLAAAFAPFGVVLETRVVLDRVTGRSKGYGFVTYADADSATRALSAQGLPLDGRPCTVNYATQTDLRRSQTDLRRSQSDLHRSHDDAARRRVEPAVPLAAIAGTPGDKRLFIASLPPSTSEARLRDLAGVLGDVSDCRIVIDRETGQSKGYGFITYHDTNAAANAALLGTLHIDGRRCPVNLASAKAKRLHENRQD